MRTETHHREQRQIFSDFMLKNRPAWVSVPSPKKKQAKRQDLVIMHYA
jgi:hypothetical protein